MNLLDNVTEQQAAGAIFVGVALLFIAAWLWFRKPNTVKPFASVLPADEARYLTALADGTMAKNIQLNSIFFVASQTRPNEVLVTFIYETQQTASSDPQRVTNGTAFINEIPNIFGRLGWSALISPQDRTVMVNRPGLPRPAFGKGTIDIAA